MVYIFTNIFVYIALRHWNWSEILQYRDRLVLLAGAVRPFHREEQWCFLSYMLHSIDLLSCTVNFTLSVSISVFVMLRGMLLFISLLDICINCSKIRCKVKFFYHLCRCEWSSREREVFVIQSLTLCQLQSDRLMSLLDISGAFIGHTPFLPW